MVPNAAPARLSALRRSLEPTPVVREDRAVEQKRHLPREPAPVVASKRSDHRGHSEKAAGLGPAGRRLLHVSREEALRDQATAWTPAPQRVASGEPVYRREEEGGILMRPTVFCLLEIENGGGS